MALAPNPQQPPQPPRYQKVVTITAELFEGGTMSVKQGIAFDNPNQIGNVIQQIAATLNATGLIDSHADSFVIIPIHMIKKITITPDMLVTAGSL
jgi:hypothetical protein